MSSIIADFAFYSDLHKEFQTILPKNLKKLDRNYVANRDTWLAPPNLDVAAIFFCGDTETDPDRFTRFMWDTRRSQHEATALLATLGNHEHYGKDARRTVDLFKSAIERIPNCFVLENEVLTLENGIHIAGTTLWTDLSNPLNAVVAQKEISDYRDIFCGDRKLLPSDVTALHNEAKAFLTDTLASHDPKKTILLTHHALSRQIRDPYLDQPIVPMYANDYDSLLLQYQPALVISGHIHVSADLMIGTTRYITNPRGYWSKGLNPHFQDDCRIRIESSPEHVVSTLLTPRQTAQDHVQEVLKEAYAELERRGVGNVRVLEGWDLLGERSGQIVALNGKVAAVHLGGSEIAIAEVTKRVARSLGDVVVLMDGTPSVELTDSLRYAQRGTPAYEIG